MQNTPSSKLELSLLGIFRWMIISAMFCMIAAAVVLLAVGLFNLPYTPASPEPAKAAPKPTVSGAEFLNFLNPVVEKTSAPTAGLPTTLAPDSNEAAFRAQAEQLWQHVSKYQIDCGITAALGKADFIESLRQSPLKNVLESRGPGFAESQNLFVRATLSNNEVIKLCRSGKTGWFFSSIEFHRSSWDSQIKKASSFEAMERARVADFEAAEIRKAVERKAFAYDTLRGSAIAFGLFMMVSLVLIFARIESNLRGASIEINRTL
jgi:hypothetical protein